MTVVTNTINLSLYKSLLFDFPGDIALAWGLAELLQTVDIYKRPCRVLDARRVHRRSQS